MNNFIKTVIEEKFASKAQQRYFFAKANDKKSSPKEKKKWKKWAKDFSNKTDFKKIPEKVDETDIDEVVDEKGDIITSKKPNNLDTKGITSKSTTDQAVKTGYGQMGSFGTHGTQTALKYWAEADVSKALGADDTINADVPYDEALKHFTKKLGLSPEEAKERMAQLGYDEKLPDDKVRLVENPKKFIEEYIDSILDKKSNDNDIIEKKSENKKIDPIIIKQFKAFKNTLDKNKLTLKDVIDSLENE